MDHERAAPLIAELAMGRLDGTDRREVELHAENCETCRGLLEQARELRAVLSAHRPEDLLAHVQSAHLTRYALHPEQLAPELASRIESHVADCTVCREAAEIVRAAHAATRERRDAIPTATPTSARTPERRTRGGRGGLWSWLSGTILRPAPALAYLVLLAVVVGMWSARRPPVPGPAPVPVPVPEETGTGIELLPRPVEVYPPDRFRSETAAASEPVEVSLAGGDLYLRVFTELEDDVLEDDAASFRLEIVGDDKVVASRTLDRAALGDYGVLDLRLPGDRFEPGKRYGIELRRLGPGAEGTGELLFGRELLVAP